MADGIDALAASLGQFGLDEDSNNAHVTSPSLHSPVARAHRKRTANQGGSQSLHVRRTLFLNVESFVDFDSIPQDLICVLCAEVMIRPSKTPCGHTFCEDCLNMWFLNQSVCPIDRNPVDASQLRSNMAAADDIARLKLRCFFAEHGCAFTGTRAERETHRDACPFRPVDCPHKGCSDLVLEGTFDKHVQTCPCRVVSCPNSCGWSDQKKKLHPHMASDCPRALITCPHNCGESVLRADLHAHFAACQHVTVKCPHAGLGCRVETTRSNIGKHIPLCPYEALKEYLYQQRHETIKLRQEVRQLRTQVYLMNKRAFGLQGQEQAGGLRLRQDKDFDAINAYRNQHAAYAETYARIYINQPDLFRVLDRYVSGNDQALIIHGDSGSGKSSLLANWAYEYEALHADVRVVCHFVGCSSESSSLVNIIHRIIQEIRYALNCSEEPESSPQLLLSSFPSWIQRCANSTMKLVFIIDGLNIIDDSDDAHSFKWIPCLIPSQVRLILSTTEGKCLDALRKREFKFVQMHPLSEGDRKSLAIELMSHRGRELSRELLDKVASPTVCGSPLHLKTLIEEVIISSVVDERLDAKLQDYLSARDTAELFQKVLQRWEQTYGDLFVKNFTSLIYCSNHGLKKEELCSLICYPQEQFNQMISEVKDYFFLRSGGTLSFSSDYMKSAVKLRYLESANISPSHSVPHDSFEFTLRRFLYTFFFKGKHADRKVEECTHHAAAMKDPNIMVECLSDTDVFLGMFTTDKKVDLFRLWRECGGYKRALESYTRLIPPMTKKPYQEDSLNFMEKIATFAKEVGLYNESSELFEQTLKYCQKLYGDNHIKVADALINYGIVLGYLAKRRHHIFTDAIKIIEKNCGNNHIKLAKPLQELALIYKDLAGWSDAENYILRALDITKQNSARYPEDYVSALIAYGDIYREQQRYEEAITMYKEAYEFARKTLGPKCTSVIVCLNNLGLSFQYMNELDEAERHYIKAMILTKETLGEEHPNMAVRLHNLAWLEHSRGNYDKALEGYLKSMEIKEKCFGVNHKKLLIGLENIIDVLTHLQRWDEVRNYKARHEYIERNFSD